MPLKELKFLVIDDALTIRKMVTQLLAAQGCNSVSGASGGVQAWEMLVNAAESKAPFQYIICDWHMEDMSGIDLLRKLRSHPTYKEVPFLMLTSEAEAGNVVDAFVTGVDDYMFKPISPTVFQEKLLNAYNKKANPKS